MENIQEIWKDIPNYEGYYQVSNLGNVKSLSRIVKNGWGTRTVCGKILKNLVNTTKGYLVVRLSKIGLVKTKQIHQLVAEAFLNHSQKGHKLVVNHKNFNRQDNRLENLEIVTQRENTNQKHKKSKSKYIGVTWHKRVNKWTAQILYKRKNIHLGCFNNEIDAHNAYQNKLKEILTKTL